MEGFWEVIKVSKDVARMGVGAREGEILNEGAPGERVTKGEDCWEEGTKEGRGRKIHFNPFKILPEAGTGFVF